MSTNQHLVAITRLHGPIDPLVGELAAILTREPYELRTKLAGALPIVVAMVRDERAAQATFTLLARAGHGVVACGLDDVRAPIVLDRVELPAHTLTGVVAGRPIEIPLAHLSLVLEAIHVRNEETTARGAHLAFPLRRGFGANALAGTGRQSVKHDRERVLYLVRRGGEPMVVVSDTRTHLVGALHRTTRRDSFVELLRLLRERAPGLIHDTRLTEQRRIAMPTVHRNGFSGGTLPGVAFSTSTQAASNVGGTELAAHVLALAHQRGQV